MSAILCTMCVFEMLNEICFIGSKKEVGIRADEEQLKILDDVPNSAVEMIVKEKVSISTLMVNTRCFGYDGRCFAVQ